MKEDSSDNTKTSTMKRGKNIKSINKVSTFTMYFQQMLSLYELSHLIFRATNVTDEETEVQRV